jgi:hypothetical protein
MKLNEAKEILKLNGYLLEDTETQDDEMDELDAKWGKKWGDIHVSDKALDNLNKKMQNTRHKHMDLEDKINNAKNFNSWDNKDEETKIEILKDLLDDGYEFHDDNPYSEQDIMGDFYDINDLAKVYDEVVDKLEDLYERGDDFGGDWDLWLQDHTTFIIKDILNGKSAEQIIKKFKKYF